MRSKAVCTSDVSSLAVTIGNGTGDNEYSSSGLSDTCLNYVHHFDHFTV